MEDKKREIPEVECDFCHKMINVKDTHLDEAEVQGAAVKFWACPHCNRRYVVRIYTKEQIQLDEHYQLYAEELKRRRARGLSVNAARLKKLETLREKANAFQQSLKKKHLAGVTALLNGDIEPNADSEVTNTITG